MPDKEKSERKHRKTTTICACCGKEIVGQTIVLRAECFASLMAEVGTSRYAIQRLHQIEEEARVEREEAKEEDIKRDTYKRDLISLISTLAPMFIKSMSKNVDITFEDDSDKSDESAPKTEKPQTVDLESLLKNITPSAIWSSFRHAAEEANKDSDSTGKPEESADKKSDPTKS